jgi:hypothetical protein
MTAYLVNASMAATGSYLPLRCLSSIDILEKPADLHSENKSKIVGTRRQTVVIYFVTCAYNLGMKITKNYSVIIPGAKPVTIRQTTTVQHALKHACYASQLRIRVSVIDNRTQVTITELPPIDKAHAEKPHCKRDRQYLKAARKGESK